MKDDILGELKSSGEAFLGNIITNGNPVELNIDPENESIESVLLFARIIVQDMSKYNEVAKGYAAKELLDSYNESWRFYTTYDENNKPIDVEDPSITSKEFQNKITLVSISFGAENDCSLCYNDNGLFAGHSIFITSFDGAAFTDLHAELFG